jgi:chromate reductase
MQIVTLCGSLRARSLNRALLRAYERLAPPELAFAHYEKIGTLPHFNPDLDGETPPSEVAAFRGLVANADALVISTPEYVHALPGSFKNALDWLVSDPSFVGKSVVILHAERGSTRALDSLREVLKTMSARLIESASVLLPFGTNQLDEDAILAREDLRRLLRGSMESLRHHLTGTPQPPAHPEQPAPRRLPRI